MTDDSRLGRLRHWLNSGGGKWIAIGICLSVLAGAVIIWVYRPSGTEAKARDLRNKGWKLDYYCRACREGGSMSGVPIDQAFPVACPRCGKNEAYMGFKCIGCRKVFEKPDQPTYDCPYCGFHYDVRLGRGSADPDAPRR